MFARHSLRLTLVLVLTASCARKLVPPSPDHFPPHLTRLQAPDSRHLRLTFSEPLDSTALAPGNLRVGADSAETLAVRFVLYGFTNAELTLVTDRQSVRRYRLTGTVTDTAGNRRHLDVPFRGSAEPDTARPRLLSLQPAPGALNIVRPIVLASFSEPLDTLAGVRWFFAPRPGAPRFRARWSPNQAVLEFTPTDTLAPDSVVYVAVLGARDFDGNRLVNPGSTFFSRDTVPAPVLLAGTVAYRQQPVNGALVLCRDDTAVVACAVSDLLGQFSLRLRRTPRRVLVVADTSADGIVDLAADFPDGRTGPVLELGPTAPGRSLDDALR